VDKEGKIVYIEERNTAIDPTGAETACSRTATRSIGWKIADERPGREVEAQEILTIASAILGQGQLSLAKYLFIAAKEDAPELDVRDIAGFFRHILERFDPEADLHFQTRTTIDTLDYSAGMGLNAGSKVVVAAAGPKRRELGTKLPPGLKLPEGFRDPRVVMPGVLAVVGPRAEPVVAGEDADIARLCDALGAIPLIAFPLVTVVDDSAFASQSLTNWLWVSFTRSDPANDLHGVGASTHRKHWGCRGPVVIDARLKPHMAPPLEEDPAVARRVDALFAKGGPLHGIGG
jgi:4-hydroxy-3-polyprenylbenzoate decarboxylase